MRQPIFNYHWLVSLCLLAIGSAQAAQITVTSTSTDPMSTECTLRNAVLAANSDSAQGDCPAGSGSDEIFLPEDSIIEFDQAEDAQADCPNALPVITGPTAINGQGATLRRSPAASDPFRLLEFIPTAADGNGVAFLTLEGGRAESVTMPGLACDGGALRYADPVGSSLGLLELHVLNNRSVDGSGGGIYADGQLINISESVLRNNDAALDGGGAIFPAGGGLFNTSVIDNTAGGDGGGIAQIIGAGGFLNVTFSGNASQRGAAILFEGGPFSATLDLFHVTIFNNLASVSGSGIFQTFGMTTLNLRTSVIEGPMGVSVCDDSTAGAMITSDGFNVLDSDCDAGNPDDLIDVDPMLGPLIEINGQFVHVQSQDSPLVDVQGITNFANPDQLGTSRPQDGDLDGMAFPDIGAVELDIIFADGLETAAMP